MNHKDQPYAPEEQPPAPAAKSSPYAAVARDEVYFDEAGGQLIRVNGVSFRPGYPDNLLGLKSRHPEGKDIPVRLEREPNNRFDPNAVKVMIGGDHVGYIPKAFNTPIQTDMDAGHQFVCRVDEVLILPAKPRQPGLTIYVKKAPGGPV